MIAVFLIWGCGADEATVAPCVDPEGALAAALQGPSPDQQLVELTTELGVASYYFCASVVDRTLRNACETRAAQTRAYAAHIPPNECDVPQLSPSWVQDTCPGSATPADLGVLKVRRAVVACSPQTEHRVLVEVTEHGAERVCVDAVATHVGTPERCLAEVAGTWRLEDIHGPGTYEVVVSID